MHQRRKVINYINSGKDNNNQCLARHAYGCKQHGVTNYIATVTEVLSPNQTKFQHGEATKSYFWQGKAESVFFKSVAPSKAPLEDHKSKNVWGSTNWF